MSCTRAPATATPFGELDLESDELPASDERCSYAPPVSEISALRPPAPPVIEDEPLRETREPFRAAVRDTEPHEMRPSGMRLSAPGSIEEAVLRALEALESSPDAPEREIPKA